MHGTSGRRRVAGGRCRAPKTATSSARRTRFRNWVTPDGSAGPSGEGGFKAEAGRYHLYVSLACPWAHRTVIFRKLKALENVISMSVVSPDMWQGRLDLRQGRGLDRRRRQRQEQAVRNLSAGRSAIYRPRQRAGAVGQEAQDDRQQRVVRNHPHAQFGVRRVHRRAHRLLSAALARPRSTASTTSSIPNINNGVYRAGFATTQEAYEAGVPQRVRRARRDRADLCRSSAISSARQITEADWRLFSHAGAFRRRLLLRTSSATGGTSTNIRICRITCATSTSCRASPRRSASTQIKRHYYGSQRQVNPTGIVPVGPQLDFSRAARPREVRLAAATSVHEFSLGHRQMMDWWCAPCTMMPRKPSALSLTRCARSAPATVSFTPFGISSVAAVQPSARSSATCAGTMRLMATRVRPSPVTEIVTPVSVACVVGFRVQRHLVHVDQVLTQGGDIDLRPVGRRVGFERAHDFLHGAEGVVARQCRRAAQARVHVVHSGVRAHRAPLAVHLVHLHHAAVHRTHLIIMPPCGPIWSVIPACGPI